jgi:hypothetical protein
MRHFSWISTLFLASALPLVAQVTVGPLTNYSAPSGSSQSTTISADLDHDGNPDLITLDQGLNQLLIRYGRYEANGAALRTSETITVQ